MTRTGGKRQWTSKSIENRSTRLDNKGRNEKDHEGGRRTPAHWTNITWTFKAKFKDGKHDKFRARLVLRGDLTKQYYSESERYSPTLKAQSTKLILAHALEKTHFPISINTYTNRRIHINGRTPRKTEVARNSNRTANISSMLHETWHCNSNLHRSKLGDIFKQFSFLIMYVII